MCDPPSAACSRLPSQTPGNRPPRQHRSLNLSSLVLHPLLSSSRSGSCRHSTPACPLPRRASARRRTSARLHLSSAPPQPPHRVQARTAASRRCRGGFQWVFFRGGSGACIKRLETAAFQVWGGHSNEPAAAASVVLGGDKHPASTARVTDRRPEARSWRTAHVR